MNLMLRDPVVETKVYAFREGDRVEYKEVIYRWLHDADKGHLFQRTDDDGPPEYFSHAELTRLFTQPRDRMGYLPRKRSAPSSASDPLSLLEPEEKRSVMFRLQFCKEFAALKSKSRKTSTDDETVRQSIHAKMTKDALEAHLASGKNARTFVPLAHYPNGRELRRWRERWRKANFDPIAFVRADCGDTGRAEYFAPEVASLIQGHLEIFASGHAPDVKTVHQMLQDAVGVLNKRRKEAAEADGLVPPEDLAAPHYDTMLDRVGKMPKAWIARGRDGEDAALRYFRAVNGGLDAVAPMEYLQIDESRLDLRTILEIAGTFDTLSEKEKKVVLRVRLWVTAVIDVATRSIVALRIHHSPPSSASAIAALEMVTRDKREFGKFMGCQTEWIEHGNLGEIMSDSAAWLTSDDVHATVIDAGGDVFHPRAGDPPMRGAIERWFRTMNRQALAFWSGRTWGSVEEKGDYKIAAKLCYDVASKLLYRYLIDVYPNQPHHALFEEHPRDCWIRLNKFHKPTPPLSADLRRHAFGIKVKRTLHKTGIYFLGIRYHSTALQKLFLDFGGEVDIRVDRFDLGAISVMHPKGMLTVRSFHREFAGMSIYHWMAFNARLKLFNKQNASVPRSVALKAKEDIRNQAMLADAENELGTVIVTDELFAKFEKKLAFRVDIVEDGAPGMDDFEVEDDIQALFAELDDRSATIVAAAMAKPTPPQKVVPPTSDNGGTLLDSSFDR